MSSSKKASGMPNDEIYNVKKQIQPHIRKYKDVVLVKGFRRNFNHYENARYCSVALSLYLSGSVELNNVASDKNSVINTHGNIVAKFAKTYLDMLTATRVIEDDDKSMYISYPKVNPKKLKKHIKDTLQ